MQFTTTILAAALALSASALPSNNAKRYVPGWCGMHIQQYQIGEGPGDTSQYRLTIELFDANHAPLGGVNTANVPDGGSVDVGSALPNVYIAAVAYVDSDPVLFAYGGQKFDSSSPQCSMGEYDNGSRQGDCGFTC